MTRWIPVNDPPPPDDGHTWARPAGNDCPNCDCCTAALCQLAIAKDEAGEWNGACHFLGTSADYDLADCPCWRNRSGHMPVGGSRSSVATNPARAPLIAAGSLVRESA